MTKITILKKAYLGHYQIMYNEEGPYSIGSTVDIKIETVIKKIQLNNPHATVEVEK